MGTWAQRRHSRAYSSGLEVFFVAKITFYYYLFEANFMNRKFLSLCLSVSAYSKGKPGKPWKPLKIFEQLFGRECVKIINHFETDFWFFMLQTKKIFNVEITSSFRAFKMFS